MKAYYFLLLLLSTSHSFSQTLLDARIRDVTVFLQGAYVTRVGEARIETGENKLVLRNVSKHINSKSIQVKADGDFTILGINQRYDYLSTSPSNEKSDSLYGVIDSINNEISILEARQKVLNEKSSFLSANKSISSNEKSVVLEDLEATLNFYEKQFMEINNEEIKIKIATTQLNNHKKRLQKQIADSVDDKEEPITEIVIKIDSDKTTLGKFEVSYLVANAGWFSNYDIRVNSINEPLNLIYKASVYQNTGVDWSDVNLTFSNATPNESGVAPVLKTWRLNYARNTVYTRSAPYLGGSNSISGVITDSSGEPLIGANVMIQGTNFGTITDLDGNYELTLPADAKNIVVSYTGFETTVVPISSNVLNITLNEGVILDEVVVTALGTSGKSNRANKRVRQDFESNYIETTIVENQTTFEQRIDRPYSITSSGERIEIELRDEEIDVLYDYISIPKIRSAAYLQARIVNWDEYNLLEGEANLYFEDTYLGRTILDTRQLVDTLEISLGDDKGVVIKREKIRDFSKRRVIGSNKIESRGFKILIRNNKSSDLTIQIKDQIPVSGNNNITITEGNLNGGILESTTGMVAWEIEVKAGEQREVQFSYDVKYPKGEKIILE